jgi:hypothetical protein
MSRIECAGFSNGIAWPHEERSVCSGWESEGVCGDNGVFETVAGMGMVVIG